MIHRSHFLSSPAKECDDAKPQAELPHPVGTKLEERASRFTVLYARGADGTKKQRQWRDGALVLQERRSVLVDTSTGQSVFCNRGGPASWFAAMCAADRGRGWRTGDTVHLPGKPSFIVQIEEVIVLHLIPYDDEGTEARCGDDAGLCALEIPPLAEAGHPPRYDKRESGGAAKPTPSLPMTPLSPPLPDDRDKTHSDFPLAAKKRNRAEYSSPFNYTCARRQHSNGEEALSFAPVALDWEDDDVLLELSKRLTPRRQSLVVKSFSATPR